MSSTNLSSQTNETPEELEHSDILDNSNMNETINTEENQNITEESELKEGETSIPNKEENVSQENNSSAIPTELPIEEHTEENSLPPVEADNTTPEVVEEVVSPQKEDKPLSEIQIQFNDVITSAPVLESEKIATFSHIIGNETIDYQSILNECYVNNQIVVPIRESSDCVLISKYNQINENEFYCCKTHSIGELNYKTRLFTITKTLNKDDSIEKIAKPTEKSENIIKKLDDYLNEEFEGDKGYHVEERDDKVIIIYSICLSQKDISGYWNCNYEIIDNKINGKCKINIHHSDESSVDVNYSKNVEDKEVKDEDEIISYIKSIDGEILSELSDYFCNEKDEWLKDFRRQLPISKVKFNWENVGGF